jgi:AcrR family transcriptional regulator
MARSSTKPATTGDHRAQRRQAILETATRLFADIGFADCEMERVALEVGIAKGTLYLYFRSKEELFYACVDRGMRELQSVLKQAVEAQADWLQRIPAGIYAYLQFFDEHPELAELIIQERASFKNRKRPTYFEHRDANRGMWRDLYTTLIEHGRLRDDLPLERLLDTIGNMLYGTMFTNHFIGRSVPLTDQYEAIVEVVFRGLLSDSERKGLSHCRRKA